MVDETEDNHNVLQTITQEFLNSLSPRSLPPLELKIRKNCVVILIRNINCNEVLCNGTRLRALEYKNYILKCEILNGDKTGEIAFINRITLSCEDEYPFTFKR